MEHCSTYGLGLSVGLQGSYFTAVGERDDDWFGLDHCADSQHEPGIRQPLVCQSEGPLQHGPSCRHVAVPLMGSVARLKRTELAIKHAVSTAGEKLAENQLETPTFKDCYEHSRRSLQLLQTTTRLASRWHITRDRWQLDAGDSHRASIIEGMVLELQAAATLEGQA